MVKPVTKYVANDGTEFDSEAEAITHERKIAFEQSDDGKRQKRYQDAISAWGTKDTVAKYGLNHVGVWEIYGEDANADFGGSHHEPLLATVEGTLDKAIRYAIDLDRFYTWGGGGKVEPAIKTKLIKL